ncbi:beta-propeller fold lactonase family protein, partial [Streptomyces flaveolus]|uniref:lactonase family protein n=1 Tax=Streptomyces flaveolus TaxID=67297 RepID=UPI00332AE55A
MSGDGWSRRKFAGVLARTAAAAALPAVTACDDTPAPGSAATPAASGGAAGREHAPSGPRPLHLGTYTSAEGGGRGIGLAEYDARTGRITGLGTVTGVADPSYLAVHPAGHTLYAVNEREDGAVTAVRLSDRRILGSRSTGGSAPCHLSVHPSGRWLLSANYGSGSVAVHPVEASGALGEPTAVVTHSAPPP